MAEATSLLAAALDALRRGWRVFPLVERGKRPLVHGGVKVATADEAQVRSWWRVTPEANVGIACGAPSNLLVLDVDGDPGAKSLRRLVERHGPLPSTLTVTTARGRHHYFAADAGVKNSASKLGSGLDVRSDGGHVVGAGSVHESGAAYRYVEPAAPVAAVPSWLAALLREPDSRLTHSTHRPHQLEPVWDARDACYASDSHPLDEELAGLLPRPGRPRHRALFDVACLLKARAPKDGPERWRSAVEAWHARAFAEGRCKTESPLVTWAEFVTAFGRVDLARAGGFERAVAMSKSMHEPTAARRYPDETTKRLVRLCVALDEVHGGGSWPLSCRKAGAAVGASHDTAAALLRGLMLDGLLVLDEEADGPNRRARTYRWVGGRGEPGGANR